MKASYLVKMEIWHVKQLHSVLRESFSLDKPRENVTRKTVFLCPEIKCLQTQILLRRVEETKSCILITLHFMFFTLSNT